MLFFFHNILLLAHRVQRDSCDTSLQTLAQRSDVFYPHHLSVGSITLSQSSVDKMFAVPSGQRSRDTGNADEYQSIKYPHALRGHVCLRAACYTENLSCWIAGYQGHSCRPESFIESVVGILCVKY